MIIHNFEQYSPEWWAIRQGIPTASCASNIITAAKGDLSVSCRNYINELLAEKKGLGDPPMEPTDWMKRGTELEPEARRFFTFETGLQTQEVGIVLNDNGTAGASADALIPNQDQTLFDEMTADEWHVPPGVIRAGLEIKCPKPSTHIGYLLNPGLPNTYKQQVHFSLAVSGLDLWYWMSYHPELDPVIIQVERDEYTEKVEKAIDQFLLLQFAAMEQLGIS